ncbi:MULTISPECIES: hypothetical protein [Aeromicrobium]|uniref:hypothetical protein n=1 Tax=Aeromicrobium TaxID=2040 RepID=UPI0006FD3C41|nr:MULTISPECIES: hypothetical protein [Aeromicrobium]KQX73722.1 hypothetical protein ASD10_00105 [Aeromicrobium sp. Root472D3]MCL8252487.1 hypothetical protein [Aeromicrobium fastidiosum]
MSSDAAPAPDAAEAIASATLAVAGVSALHAGVVGEVATYLPGRRVNGVRLRDDSCEVHIVLEWGSPVVATADDVRTAIEPLVDVPVHVTVEDVAGPGDTL